MIRAQRTAHVRAWMILAPLALLALVVALAMRPPAPVQPTPGAASATGDAP